MISHEMSVSQQVTKDVTVGLLRQRSGVSRLCVFRETMSTNHFTELQSVSVATWRVGFKRNGRPVSTTINVDERRRRRRQRCFQFLKHGAETRGFWERRKALPVPLGRVDQQPRTGSRLINRRRRRRMTRLRSSITPATAAGSVP